MACVKVVVFSAGTAEVSVSVLKRPPADEGSPAIMRRHVEEVAPPEGIIHWVVVLVV